MYLSNAALKCFLGCPKRFEYRYVDCLRKSDADATFSFKASLKEALKPFLFTGNRSLLSLNDQEEIPVAEMAKRSAILSAYMDRYENFYSLVYECFYRSYTAPSARDKAYSKGGDAILLKHKSTNELYLLEHRITSSIDDYTETKAKADFWSFSDLAYLESELGERISGVIFHILEKPRIRLKQKETEEEFRLRCLDEAKKSSAFKEIVIRIDPNERDWHRSATEEIIQSLVHCAKHDKFYYRNPSQCFLYGKPCEYLALCLAKGRDEEALKEYVVKDTSLDEDTDDIE